MIYVCCCRLYFIIYHRRVVIYYASDEIAARDEQLCIECGWSITIASKWISIAKRVGDRENTLRVYVWIFKSVSLVLYYEKMKHVVQWKQKRKVQTINVYQLQCCALIVGQTCCLTTEYVRCWKFKMILIQWLSIDEMLFMYWIRWMYSIIYRNSKQSSKQLL